MSLTRAISTTSRRELSSSFFFLQSKAPKEIQAILTETLDCFLLGRAKDLSAPLYFRTSSSVVNWFSSSQEIPRILWDPNVHFHIQKSTPHIAILRQLRPFYALTTHFLKIHLHNLLPPTSGSSKWFLSLRFPHYIPVNTSPLPHTYRSITILFL